MQQHGELDGKERSDRENKESASGWTGKKRPFHWDSHCVLCTHVVGGAEGDQALPGGRE